MTKPSARLTQRELRAINEALGQLLAGEFEPTHGTSGGDYESAKAKIEGRIRWREGE